MKMYGSRKYQISIPNPWMLIENSKRVEGFKGQVVTGKCEAENKM